jgi:two-component system, OmpR family, phosphate regulon response regulator PhoB
MQISSMKNGANSMRDDVQVIIASCDSTVLQDFQALQPTVPVVDANNSPFQFSVTGNIWAFVDWVLPDISGLEYCRRLKAAARNSNVHITMIVDSNDSDSQRRALQAGADDYIAGPIDARRISHRLELYFSADGSMPSIRKLMHGDLLIDTAAIRAQYQGKAIPLGPTEFRLLTHFMEHPDRVFSRQSLIGIIGRNGRIHDDKTVNVWVGRLRKAFIAHGVPDPIRTVRSVGYVFDRI